ncbi:hypothetical protein HOU02_gp335 [Caulobacter phage CcrBL9]|uniref:Uncharacterized protein n=1 Tax=Caulobacter phage CcrBL9 TaxID=2283270 RepID=A0A385ECL3_9CAUD|nr:hypothetical protein HOU02_gp335 [Caulobacter phage CcrBL9]AXQ69390.1 hypothetical protein CcrBL9_gp366c [Caulobacter phage CcrBL9]
MFTGIGPFWVSICGIMTPFVTEFKQNLVNRPEHPAKP